MDCVMFIRATLRRRRRCTRDDKANSMSVQKEENTSSNNFWRAKLCSSLFSHEYNTNIYNILSNSYM